MTDEMSQLDLLRSIERKLDRVIGILAIQGKEKDEQLRILHALEFESGVIAALIGVTPGYARAWKSRQQNKKRASKA
jgi:hypothetical protein